ncbi:MAG TPA: MFS transporter [Gammaproteobacteria bacterium]|nr:MFS transporter [Gammaproteobacteria bacterium]
MTHSHQHEKTIHTTLAWVVTLTASLFFFYEFIQLNLFNAIDEPLMRDFGLNSAQLGQLASMYFYANAIFLFPAGNLLDRYSTKKLLLFAVAICTIGTFIFALAKGVVVAALGRFLVGSGASFCFLSCIRIASRWFPPHRMAFVTGVVVVMAMLGGLVAQTPFALLVEYVNGWRQAVLLDAFLGVIIYLAIAFLVQDRPPDALEGATIDRQHLQRLGLWHCIKLAALNPQNWWGGIYTSLMNLPVFLLGALWGMHYLVVVRHVTLVQASYATTMFFIGVIIGSPLFGWFSDRIGRRVLPMIIGAVLSLVIIFILMYMPDLSLQSIIFLFLLIGLVTSSQVLTYPTVAELNPIYLTSTAVSIESICIMASGFIFQPFFGWIMQQSSAHTVIKGMTVYTTRDFDLAMIIMPVAFVIALVVTLFIRETYCSPQA